MTVQTINYPNIPPAWEQARYEISKLFSKLAVIAGGAVRDHLLGIPHNDLDIFILETPAEWQNYDKTQRLIRELLGLPQPKWSLDKAEPVEAKTTWKDDFHHPYSSHHHVAYKGLDVDLVFSECLTMDAVVNSFDVGLCKVGWDGTNYLISQDFVRDAEHKTLTITPDKPSFADHKQRLEKKFLPLGYSWRFCPADEDVKEAA